VQFAFTDEQLAFRDTVRDLLAAECPPAAVRDAWTSPSGRSPEAWAGLAGLGVLGALAPEEAGGLGLTLVDIVLVLEESGYAALPEPIVEHAAVAVPLLADPAAADGSVTLTATSDGHDVALWADTADRVALVDGDRWRMVERGDVTLHPVPSVDGARRAFACTAPPGAGVVVADPQASERGALGAAAQLVGLARRMLDLTVAYVGERQQFGVPIGSFQAVKHHLADARLALEFARPLVYRAAWSLAEGDPEAALHVSMAKSKAGEAAHESGRQALQCHGAMGYSFEYDLHLFLKRAWALEAAWGDAAWHRARLGRAIL
jgi:alkylation response protein AidB-like acyl-CoA dehydrogenase